MLRQFVSIQRLYDAIERNRLTGDLVRPTA
jgi:hypothetical protein